MVPLVPSVANSRHQSVAVEQQVLNGIPGGPIKIQRAKLGASQSARGRGSQTAIAVRGDPMQAVQRHAAEQSPRRRVAAFQPPQVAERLSAYAHSPRP
jgi:hypothetical protein